MVMLQHGYEIDLSWKKENSDEQDCCMAKKDAVEADMVETKEEDAIETDDKIL